MTSGHEASPHRRSTFPCSTTRMVTLGWRGTQTGLRTRMQRAWRVFLCFGFQCVIASLCVSACEPPGNSDHLPMRHLAYELYKYAEAHDGRYPDTLADLRQNESFDPALLLSPGSRRQPGAMEDAEQWTDFLYVSGLTLDDNKAEFPILVEDPGANDDGGAWMIDLDLGVAYASGLSLEEDLRAIREAVASRPELSIIKPRRWKGRQ